MTKPQATPIFYGWWIVAAAFLNLFFVVGIIFYGFPVFYPAFIEALGFTRSQVTQGFFLGMLAIGLPSGLLAGALIDRIGARWIILTGVGFIGVSLLLMGSMTRFWHYELLCIMEVLGFVLAGPIANQVLVARWFRKLRGRAMGYAYLGLGLGGVVAPPLTTFLIQRFGWRHALEAVGLLIMVFLFPTGIWITRSSPADLGLFPDGATLREKGPAITGTASKEVGAALHSRNFWLIVLGSALVVGAIGAVIQHYILFLRDRGYSAGGASQFLSVLLVSSLAGRVLVGYMADRFSKKNIMALFYSLIGASVLLLGVAHGPVVLWIFTVAFGFSMGADYMLIPLVVAECFGTESLGKLLALIIMGYSLGQWGAPWMVGRIFDAQHSYDLAWKIMAVGALLGAAAVYSVSSASPEA
ncbi:MAG: MFS transporter [Acidobacteria bacterium]|nr:MFS transporter [Acidobacteriota bacterium]